MQLASKRIFAVLRRVRAELSKSLNPAALDLFTRRGVITHGERDDYLDYWRKRTNLTEQQRNQKLAINERILSYVDQETARLIENFRQNGLKPRRV
jgi:hypothetical protein